MSTTDLTEEVNKATKSKKDPMPMDECQETMDKEEGSQLVDENATFQVMVTVENISQ